jgi:hypothetical protein
MDRRFVQIETGTRTRTNEILGFNKFRKDESAPDQHQRYQFQWFRARPASFRTVNFGTSRYKSCGHL